MTSELAVDNPYMKMVVNILHVGNMIDKKVNLALKEFEITHVQFNVLRILELEYPNAISLSDVANSLFFPTSDVSRLIQRLVKREYINRNVCPDNRRKVDLSITEKGLDTIKKSLPEISNALDGFYKNIIKEDERDVVLHVLRKLKKVNR